MRAISIGEPTKATKPAGRQHAPWTVRRGPCRERGVGAFARPGQLRALRSAFEDPLSRTQRRPRLPCAGKIIVEGRGCYCLNVGGVQIDEAFARTFLAAIEPAKLAATLAAAGGSRLTLRRWSRMAASRRAGSLWAKRAGGAIAPSICTTGLVARGLEASGAALG